MADLETAHATLDHSGLTGVGGDVAAHEADTTAVHGIANTANLYVAGGTDVAVADGGTGASSASAARTNLGLGTMAVEAKTITTQDDLLVGGASGALARLGKGSDGQVLTVDPTTHHLVWASPAAGVTEIADLPTAETDSSLVLAPDGAGGVEFRAEAGGGGGSALLAVTSYAPGSDGAIASVGSGTLVDADATNLAVTFTAPASGNVLVRLTGLTGPTGSGASIIWGIRESSSIIAGPALIWPAGQSAGQTLTGSFYITGVSAGSHTYKWGLAGSGTSNIYGGPNYGKAVMEVYGAP